jgi:hypothetical protein
MLHPARPRINLPVFLLGSGPGLSLPVKKKAPGTGGPLINGGDIFHREASFFLLKVTFLLFF